MGAYRIATSFWTFRGGEPLVAGHRKRDGYFRADTADSAALVHAMFRIAQHVGNFEKPLYVNFEASLCAHSRSEKTGCTRCLDVCPAGAIRPDGETVTIGCGNLRRLRRVCVRMSVRGGILCAAGRGSLPQAA